MADITYYEDDYIATGYYVYTADAQIALGDYIEPDFIATDYFPRTGSIATLVCEGTRIRYVEASANIQSVASTSITGSVDRRTEVTLNSIANVNSQADRFRGHTATINGQFSLDSTATRTQTASANFSSIAVTLTAVAKNATGTITLESAASLSVIIGAIKQATFSSAIGVDSTSEPNSTASPFLKFGSSTTVTPLDYTGITTTDRFIFSAWMYNPIGYVFDTDPNYYIYTASGQPPDWDNNSIQIETESGLPRFIYHGKNGKVVFDLGFANRYSGYRHYLFRVDLDQATYTDRYRLFVDGTEKSILGVYSKSGVGAGLTYTANTSTLIPLTVFDQYQLMMNTSGGTLKLGSSSGPNGGGYGDSLGVKADRSALTQFWFDYDAASYDIGNLAYRSKFYDGGYLDLGDSGTSTGLTQPKHYVRLQNYQDTLERGTKKTLQNSWLWRELVYDSAYGPGKEYYTVESYAATQDQNSVNQLPGIRVTAYLTAAAVTVLEVAVYAQAQSQLQAIAGYRVNINESLTASATVTAEVNAEFDTSTSLTALATVTALGYRQQQAEATIAATATVTCDYLRVRLAQAELSAQTTFTAQVGERTQFETQLVSTVTQSVTITRRRDLDATLSTQALITATIDDRLRDQTATLVSSSTLACEAINLEGVNVPMISTVSLQIESEVVKVATAPLSLQFTQTAEGYKVAFGSATLSALMFELTQGDILNFAPELTYVVRSESRQWRVIAESRLISIDPETRTRRVRPETRILTPDRETYVNII